MQPRIDCSKAAPDVFAAMRALQRVADASPLGPALLDLVKTRASQINGCAFCIDMHTKDARAMGEAEQRLYALNAWHEAPFYTDRERAALAWTEAVTSVADGHVPDDVYAQTRQHFNEQELAALLLTIASVNVWNRINVATHQVAGAEW